MDTLSHNQLDDLYEFFVLINDNKNDCFMQLFAENITIYNINNNNISIKDIKIHMDKYIDEYIHTHTFCTLLSKTGTILKLKIIKYIYSKINITQENSYYFITNRIITVGATQGNLKLLQYVKAIKGFKLSDQCKINAIQAGHLDCLQYLHENGYKWFTRCTDFAAEGGHIECLKYIRNLGCKWGDICAILTVMNRKLDCLKYAIENGCPYQYIECVKEARQNNHQDCVDYLNSLN